MPFTNGDIDRLIDTLHSIKLIRGCYASSEDSVTRVDDALDMLTKSEPAGSPMVGIAGALQKVFGSG
jgi:hypothetical protein